VPQICVLRMNEQGHVRFRLLVLKDQCAKDRDSMSMSGVNPARGRRSNAVVREAFNVSRGFRNEHPYRNSLYEGVDEMPELKRIP